MKVGVQWGAWLRAVALLVGIAVFASGCMTATAKLIGPRDEVQYFDSTHVVHVRSVPDGARVRGEGGAMLATPTAVEVPYRFKRVGTRYRIWPIAIAAVATLAVFGGSFYSISSSGESLTDLGAKQLLTLGSVYDLMSGAYFIPTQINHNMRWRDFAERVPVPTTTELTLDWDGWAPATVSVTAPLQNHVTARRQGLGTFDEALIQWERTANVAPESTGLFNIAAAYDRLAERTGQPEHVQRAVHYYGAYLAFAASLADSAGTREVENQARSRLRVLQQASTSEEASP